MNYLFMLFMILIIIATYLLIKKDQENESIKPPISDQSIQTTIKNKSTVGKIIERSTNSSNKIMGRSEKAYEETIKQSTNSDNHHPKPISTTSTPQSDADQTNHFIHKRSSTTDDSSFDTKPWQSASYFKQPSDQFSSSSKKAQKPTNEQQSINELTIITKNGKKFCQYPIEDDWYLTRIKKFRCKAKQHNTIMFYGLANIYSRTKKRNLNIHFPAYYCQTCDQLMIKESVYRKISNDGKLLCHYVLEDFWKPKLPDEHTSNHFVPTFGNEESVLHKLGYNVNSQIGLTPIQRHAILRQIIVNGQLSKSEVVHHLRYLIRRNRSNRKFKRAIQKWQADLEYVYRMNLSYSRIPIQQMRALLSKAD